MTSSTPDMIASGVPYEVTGLQGQAPSTLEEFTGLVMMHIHGLTGDHQIVGSGEHPHDGTVRLHEKGHDGGGNDVRVWAVSPALGREGFDAAG